MNVISNLVDNFSENGFVPSYTEEELGDNEYRLEYSKTDSSFVIIEGVSENDDEDDVTTVLITIKYTPMMINMSFNAAVFPFANKELFETLPEAVSNLFDTLSAIRSTIADIANSDDIEQAHKLANKILNL